MRRILICIAAGLALGVFSAYLAINQVSEMLSISIGPWKANILAGSEAADIYTKAAVSLNALFALNSSEAVYFIAKTDSSFRPLKLECNYRVKGKNLPARWWSITVYGKDLFLIPNQFDRYSFTSVNVQRDGESWTIYLSWNQKDKNWIPLNGSGEFYLVLRLYNPERLEAIELPKIILKGCS